MSPITKPVIAFIDDEERILRAMNLLFQNTHEVFVTTDPTAFIDFIRNHKVQVAVSDQRMPERLGVDILREVKEISPNTMRILLTGYADLEAIIGSINDGEIYRYLTKPCKSEELLSVIGRATQIALETDRVSSGSAIGKNHPTGSELTFASDPLTASLMDGMTGTDTPLTKEVILVIEEDAQVYEQLLAQFSNRYHIFYADSLAMAYDYLSHYDVSVCITEVQLEHENITPLIYTLKQKSPNLVVLVHTKDPDAHALIDLINKGQIYRYLPKPIDSLKLELSVNRAILYHRSLKQVPELRQRHEVEIDTLNPQVSDKLREILGRFEQPIV